MTQFRHVPLRALLACAALSPLAHAAEAPGSPFSRAPYLQLGTESSMHIVWRTEMPIAASVRYGVDPGELGNSTAEGTIPVRTTTQETATPSGAPALHSAPKGTYQYEARIADLKPDTTYYYAVYDGEKRLTPKDPSFRFKTHPTPGTAAPLYFWVVGDSGTGGTAQAKVHTAMVEYNKKLDRNLDLYVHVGDMAYGSGKDVEFSQRFFQMYEPTLRNTVCWAAMGNHEGHTSKGESGVGPYYDAYICPTRAEAGGLPSGKEAYYSFDYGRVHFVVLDSHDLDRRPTGAMAQWLKADLEKADADWLIAYFHHPPYTKGTHDSDREQQLIEMREHIMPILEGGGVDAVFTGHSHIYERSMLVDGAYSTPTTAEGVILDDRDGDPAGDGPYRKSAGLQPHNGTVQVVAGHGGTGVGRKGTMPIMRKIIVENGSVLISVEGNTLTGTMLNLEGTVRDNFAIVKEGKVDHSVIAKPWQPSDRPGAPAATAGGKTAPKDATPLIGRGAEWAFLAGSHPPEGWAGRGFDASDWKTGRAGFGYGDSDDATVFKTMRNKFKTLYIRHEFELPASTEKARLGLAIAYDDAFIAYLNGVEVLRVGVDSGSGEAARGFHPHEAEGRFEYFALPKATAALSTEGPNVLSIEGHNANLGSSDFTLHPALLLLK